jgi:hypothetical protein
MPVYSSIGYQQTVSSSSKTAISIVAGSTARRGLIFDLNMGTQSAPASTDTNIQFALERQTAVNSGGSAWTANPNNPADAAFVGTVSYNPTGEGTITASSAVFVIGMNQRAPYRWQTYLGSGAELMYPATQSNGFALRVLSAGYTGQAGGTIYHVE